MCGILGIVTFEGRHPSPDEFNHALGQLDHRGPDDRGAAHMNGPANVRISMGQTRLSILDLSPAGHQPMTSPRTGATIVYNGEVYNFRDVRKELASGGMKFTSECDTEVLLAAYDHRQDQFIHDFRGMFAIGILDHARQRLLLLRDRLGIKPLYYYWDGRRLAFASELTALAALPGLDLEICHDAMSEYLKRGYIPHPLSIYKKVRKLPAGCMLDLNLSRPDPQPKTYWDALTHYERPLAFACEQEVLDALAERLEESVKLRLISDVPLGAFLSGGIDSSLVVAMMRRVHSGTVKTFTVGFDEPGWDEAPAAKKIAEHLGTQHEEFYISRDNLLDIVRHTADYYDEPFADSSAIPMLALSRMTRRHVTVALSGDGGDELFWGYDSYTSRSARLYPLIAAFPDFLRRGAASLMKKTGGSLNRWGHIIDYQDCAAFLLRSTISQPWHDHGLLKHGTNGSCQVDMGREIAARLGTRDLNRLMSAIDLRSYMVDDILTKVDRATMSVALEARVPILDHRVVELAAAIPYSFKTAGGEKKHLLKALLSRYVPRNLWDRPKKGFGIPLVKYFRGPLKEWARDELRSTDHHLGEWLDMSVVHRMLDDHIAGRRDASALLWACLQLAGWDRRLRRIRSGASPCPASASAELRS
jgi:asparagine synthase (glutamine-hydrolysing)